MRITARAPTALAKRWTVRLDGVPLLLSMRASKLCIVSVLLRTGISSRVISNSGAYESCARHAHAASALQQQAQQKLNICHTKVWIFLWLNARMNHVCSSIRMG